LRQPGWRAWAIAFLVASGLAVATPWRLPDSAPQNVVDRLFPARACDFIESHALSTPLFNSFAWGGYVIWRLPNMPVSVDGRTNLYGDAALKRQFTTEAGQKDWAEDPELMKAKTILLESNSPLASILRSDSRFRLLYEDKVASVFQPAGDARMQ
jgi:hypothetical protein